MEKKTVSGVQPPCYGFLIYFRNHVNLHLEVCGNKGIECQVPGCKRVVARKNYKQHVFEAAESHFNLQNAEIQRLNRILNKEVKHKGL